MRAPRPRVPLTHAGGPGSRRLLIVLALLAAQPVRGEPLPELLRAVADAGRFTTPARADARITCHPECRTVQAVLLASGESVYVEWRDGGRALVRPSGVLVAAAGASPLATVGRSLGDTSVLLEDLVVFVPSSLRVPQLSDESPAGSVVTAAPAGSSPYALLVHTIDPDRHLIVKTQYYQPSVSELAKLRRDTGFVRVGERWRPGEIAVDALRQGTTTKLSLTWREAPEVPPVLFEPAGLQQPSGLTWP